MQFISFCIFCRCLVIADCAALPLVPAVLFLPKRRYSQICSRSISPVFRGLIEIKNIVNFPKRRFFEYNIVW